MRIDLLTNILRICGRLRRALGMLGILPSWSHIVGGW